MKASSSRFTESQTPTLRRTLETLRETAISFQNSFSLNWNDFVERLECCNSAIESRCAEIGEKESLVSLRLEDVEKREAELGSLRVLLEAKLEEVAKKEEECEEIFAELRAVEECVHDRERRTEAARLHLERRAKEEEERIEGEKRECSRVLEELKEKENKFEERRKALEAKEREYEKKLEEVERLKLKEKEVREEVELRELRCEEKLEEIERFKVGVFEECKKKLEEVESTNHSVREALKLKEKELEKQQKGLELKEMEFERKLEELEKSKLVGSEESKRNEKEIEKQKKGVKQKEMEFEKKLEELERSQRIASDAFNLKEKQVEKQRTEVELKEKQYERLLKDLETKQNHVKKQRRDLDERLNILRSKEMEIKKQSEELNLREQKCEAKSKENELENKQIIARLKEVDLENMMFIERVKKEEEKMDQQLKEIDFEKNQLVIRHELAEMEYQMFMQQMKELKLKEKLLEERFREVALEKKKAADSIYDQVKREPPEIDDISGDASLFFNVKMDGKALQQFLNERERDHELLRNEVTAALGLSSNPAKLVLDAMQGFYLPHLKKGDIEFKGDVVRRSCILLLEQLRKISPPIKPRVKEEAKELAFDWKRKMRVGHEHSLEVLGFLQLLAAYKLASEFNADDLLRCLEIIAHDNRAPELFRVLGFAVQISSFIRRLVRKKKRIEAIGFVYAFDLVSKFPPVPLLKDFLEFSRISGRKDGRKLVNFDAKIEALYQKREDVKNALKCIRDHKIESDISPKQLELQISDLEKQIAAMHKNMPGPVFTIPSSPLDVRTQARPNAAAAVTPVCEPESAPSTSKRVESTVAVCPATAAVLHQQTGIKRPRSTTADDFDVPSAQRIPQKLVGTIRQ